MNFGFREFPKNADFLLSFGTRPSAAKAGFAFIDVTVPFLNPPVKGLLFIISNDFMY